MIKKCIFCNSEYEVLRGCAIAKSKYCSKKCHDEYWLKKGNKSGKFVGNKISLGKEIKLTQKLTDLQRQVVYGTLLGDASLDFTRKGSCSLRYTHKEKSLDYVLLKNNILKNFIVRDPLYIKPRTSKPINGRIVSSTACYIGKTVTHQDFNAMKDIFYKNINNKRIKIFTTEISNYLNDIGLIFWYMDDGSYTGYKNINLYTNNFSYDENISISNMLKEKFDIESKLYLAKLQNRYYIRINTLNTKKLMNIFYKIKEYIPPSMNYKFSFLQQSIGHS